MSQSQFVQEISDTNFVTDVLQSNQLALVDFWAEWCGPCRMLSPTIDELAEEYQGRVKIFKMNVDNNPGTPTQYHVRGIPTVLLFQGGQVVGQLVGKQPKDAFIEMIQRHLGSA